jgi:hypothetical protein
MYRNTLFALAITLAADHAAAIRMQASASAQSNN